MDPDGPHKAMLTVALTWVHMESPMKKKTKATDTVSHSLYFLRYRGNSSAKAVTMVSIIANYKEDNLMNVDYI